MNDVFAETFDNGDPLPLNVLRTGADFLASQIVMFLAGSSLRRAVKAKESVICFGDALVTLHARRKTAQRGHVFKYVEVVNDAASVRAIGVTIFVKNTRKQEVIEE